MSLAALVLGLPFASPATAAEGLPKRLSCSFPKGSTITYTGGLYKSSRAKALAFDIGDIDLDAQKADLVTSGGKGQLRVVRAVNANHFLEVVNEGFLNMTTIYDFDPKRKAHPAVHSRHLGVLGEPVVAQYHGFCTPK